MASKLLSMRMLAALISRWIIRGWPAHNFQLSNRKMCGRLYMCMGEKGSAEFLTVFMKVSKTFGGA
jgi:hypothetical protein